MTLFNSRWVAILIGGGVAPSDGHGGGRVARPNQDDVSRQHINSAMRIHDFALHFQALRVAQVVGIKVGDHWRTDPGEGEV